MNTCRFGTTAVSECLYSVSFERTMHKFGMTAVTNGTSVQCPPDYLEWQKKSSLCAIINITGSLQYMYVGRVVCGSHDAHVCIICPAHDITHMRKMYKALSCKRWEAGWGPGNVCLPEQLSVPNHTKVFISLAYSVHMCTFTWGFYMCVCSGIQYYACGTNST